MILKKVLILRIVFFALVLVHSVSVFSQWQLSSAMTAIDTSNYLPMFYRGALEYNLMIASSKGYTSEIERLMGKGADINVETDEGATPLILAISNYKLDAVKLLLQYNPDVNTVTRNKETPLLIAVKLGNFEISEALIRAGADVDYPDKHEATPLHFASIYGYFEIADLLLYYNASIDLKSEEGFTPLLTSIWAGYPAIADLLIQSGANMEARDNDGFTPFLLSTLYGDTLLMNMLFKFGVNIYATNYSNHNALSLSILANQIEATRLLLKMGDKWADINNSVKPYDVASKYHRKEFIDLLEKNNIPGKINYSIDQMTITAGTKFTLHDYYTGISMSFKEPYLNSGFILGCDTKFGYTRVLIQNSEHLFYQYMERSSVAYAGLFKDFALTNHPEKLNASVSASLLAGYSFGKELKGTYNTQDNKFLLIPAASFKITKMHFSLNMSIEYTKSEYYRNGPFWGRIGISYNHFFDDVRSQFKTIKWNQ